MKLGFVSAILDGYRFDEMMNFAARQGFSCVEVACWPSGKAERRYAGVSHIDAGSMNDRMADEIRETCVRTGVEISALAYYPNILDADPIKSGEATAHLKDVIRASSRLGVNLVTTFLGRNQNKTVDENLELVRCVWPELIEFAGENGVRIAVENCPMLFGEEQWPGGQNLMTTPKIWKSVFEMLDSEIIGINYDPSHFVWQMIDYIRPIYDFADRIFHVHVKDIKLYPERLQKVGVMAYPLEYMSPKLPGLGDVNWGDYFSALADIRYTGHVCLEIEDRAFESSRQDIENSLILSKRYIENYVI